MSENRWKKENFVFRLKSPLHIGYMPFKGSVVSPTRYYVPGRNFWGAVTKIVTESQYKKPEGKNYRKIGKRIIENFRFSYFYLYDGQVVYFPRYTDQGIKYGGITKAEFEHRFIGSIVSTEIEDKTRTAKDKSLHEIEFINNQFRDKNGNIKPVMIAGCIWINEDAKSEIKLKIKEDGIFVNGSNIISELILGGESKYSFGHVQLASGVEFPKTAPFKWGDIPEKIEIKQREPLVAHLKYNKNIKFEGDIELFTGIGFYDPKKLQDKDTTEGNGNICSNNSSDGKKESEGAEKPGRIISKPEFYFSPGTVLEEDINCKLNWDGTLEECYNANAPH